MSQWFSVPQLVKVESKFHSHPLTLSLLFFAPSITPKIGLRKERDIGYDNM